ncbi:MAG: ribbon-helix-helix protein, CopG family [Actinobacteria bacterium]|nr:ribbon-helix-helix protein, CopG family [Actinomycetota bacterium]
MTRMIVSVPEEFLKKIDQVAAMEHRSRSELVREALRKYLETSPEVKTKKRIEAARIMDEARDKTVGSKISGSEIVHSWRYRLAK